MNHEIPHQLANRLASGLFDVVPFNVAVIDRDFNLVAANKSFERYFGDWSGRHCYEVYKGTGKQCVHCQALATFADGKARVSDETGVDRHGRSCHYVVHMAPLTNREGKVEYVIEMTTDLTETRHWQRNYDLLFERAPCYVFVIDRNYRIIRSNEKFRQSFGEVQAKPCFKVCKRRSQPCARCPAALTFQDGLEHHSQQVGVHRDGSPAFYSLTTTPLSRDEEGVNHVIEMAADLTEIHQLAEQLHIADDFYRSLIRNAASGILALDAEGQVRVLNPAARDLLGWHSVHPPSTHRLQAMLPPDFFEETLLESCSKIEETEVTTTGGGQVPVRFWAVDLKSRGKRIGRAAFMGDLRETRRLEQEKLEAERLAAVGQTVAGLAHTIKNLLMGLEGGMYMLDSGLRKADPARVTEGWDILRRNLEKTTGLVKGFLSFSKGRLPQLQSTDPLALARSIVGLYRDAARLQGVDLLFEGPEQIAPAPLDPEGIETCLTNLVSNGIDAAMLRETGDGRVVLRVFERGDELVFEVTDNGVGMDSEIKHKVFTTFFTTKGGKGTGLGLLTTRKIIQEHGGRLDLESAPDQGSTFRISLPRARLLKLEKALETSPMRVEAQ
jgi:PAS domain S-box-containing protein